MKSRRLFAVVIVASIALSNILVPAFSFAEKDPADMVKKVGLTPRIGSSIDLGLNFTDSTGQSGPLSSFAKPLKPLVIVPVYYECPRLCGLLMTGIFDALKDVPLKAGLDFSLLFISIDPKEGPALAAERKQSRVNILKSQGFSGGEFKFLTGEAKQIQGVMEGIGFSYLPDGTKDFSHSAMAVIVSPEGKITHYFTGIEFSPRDLRLALVESSSGQVGNFIDKVLLFCFRFDHTKGEYTVFALNVMKAGGILTLIALTALYGTMWRRYRV
jgi:protein SCO1/2